MMTEAAPDTLQPDRLPHQQQFMMGTGGTMIMSPGRAAVNRRLN